MKKKSLVRASLGLVALLGGLACWGFAAGLGKSDWAAWVQAVGSILAILAGVAGLLWQGAEQRRHYRWQQTMTEWRDLSEARDLLGEARTVIHEMVTVSVNRPSFEAYFDYSTDDTRAKHLLELLRAIDTRNLPGASTKVAVRQAAEQLERCIEAEQHTRRYWERGQLADAIILADRQRYLRLQEVYDTQVKHVQDATEVMRAMFQIIDMNPG